MQGDEAILLKISPAADTNVGACWMGVFLAERGVSSGLFVVVLCFGQASAQNTCPGFGHLVLTSKILSEPQEGPLEGPFFQFWG